MTQPVTQPVTQPQSLDNNDEDQLIYSFIEQVKKTGFCDFPQLEIFLNKTYDIGGKQSTIHLNQKTIPRLLDNLQQCQNATLNSLNHLQIILQTNLPVSPVYVIDSLREIQQVITNFIGLIDSLNLPLGLLQNTTLQAKFKQLQYLHRYLQEKIVLMQSSQIIKTDNPIYFRRMMVYLHQLSEIVNLIVNITKNYLEHYHEHHLV